MSKAHVSEFWTYFTIYDIENIKCNLCDKYTRAKDRPLVLCEIREDEKRNATKINSLPSCLRECT